MYAQAWVSAPKGRSEGSSSEPWTEVRNHPPCPQRYPSECPPLQPGQSSVTLIPQGPSPVESLPNAADDSLIMPHHRRGREKWWQGGDQIALFLPARGDRASPARFHPRRRLNVELSPQGRPLRLPLRPALQVSLGCVTSRGPQGTAVGVPYIYQPIFQKRILRYCGLLYQGAGP